LLNQKYLLNYTLRIALLGVLSGFQRFY
jgi:hypothetical protein